jgi:sulfotransferase
MIDKRVYFLSGLPRTGSTLLGSILSQNPQIHVTPTSPLYQLLVDTNEAINRVRLQYTYDTQVESDVYHAMIEAFYRRIDKPIIFDKHRGWPKVLPAIKEYLNPQPKVICTVRPIAEVITSYLVLADQDPNNFIDTHLRKDGRPVTNEARADLLWREYLKVPYENTVVAMAAPKDEVLRVSYDDLTIRCDETLRTIYGWCGLEPFSHAKTNLTNSCAEAKDEAWGMKNLHTIRRTLGKHSKSPRQYLSSQVIDYFAQFDV